MPVSLEGRGLREGMGLVGKVSRYMGWVKEFRVALMGVRGCSESLGLGVGEGRRVRWGCGFFRRRFRFRFSVPAP